MLLIMLNLYSSSHCQKKDSVGIKVGSYRMLLAEKSRISARLGSPRRSNFKILEKCQKQQISLSDCIVSLLKNIIIIFIVSMLILNIHSTREFIL